MELGLGLGVAVDLPRRQRREPPRRGCGGADGAEGVPLLAERAAAEGLRVVELHGPALAHGVAGRAQVEAVAPFVVAPLAVVKVLGAALVRG